MKEGLVGTCALERQRIQLLSLLRVWLYGSPEREV